MKLHINRKKRTGIKRFISMALVLCMLFTMDSSYVVAEASDMTGENQISGQTIAGTSLENGTEGMEGNTAQNAEQPTAGTETTTGSESLNENQDQNTNIDENQDPAQPPSDDQDPNVVQDPDAVQTPEETETPEEVGTPEAVQTPNAAQTPGEAQDPNAVRTPTPEAVQSPAPAVTPEASQSPAPNQTPIPAVPEEDFSDLMSLDELTSLPDNVAKSTMWRSTAFAMYAGPMAIDNMDEFPDGESGEGEDNGEEENVPWSFSAYYVNQNDSYNVTKTDNFNLKYQMEFHTEETLEANAVEIRIPAVLFNYRGEGEKFSEQTGEAVRLTTTGVPEVADENGKQESSTTPFNYYIDKTNPEKEMLVFFNYKPITAGTNAAWQVLYRDVDIMQTVDGSAWSLEAVAEVTRTKKDGQGNATEEKVTQSQAAEPLIGHVESSVNLDYVVKTAYVEGDKLYTPGLYTQSQVERFISDGTLPEEYRDMSQWKFVVWEVQIKGHATQPWSLELLETPVAYVQDANGVERPVSGKVVGYRNNTMSGTEYAMDINLGVPFEKVVTPEGSEDPANPVDENEIVTYKAQVITKTQMRSWGNKFYIVTAYPADAQIKPGDSLENSLEVRLIPADSADKQVNGQSANAWQYNHYDWVYSGNIIKTNKISNPSGADRDSKEYKSWLEAYRQAKGKGQDYGSLYFSSTGHINGYNFTHMAPTQGEDGSIVEDSTGNSAVGSYKEGTWYQLVAADDVLYAYAKGEGDPVRLTGEDYYFSNVTITQTDNGYDISEDKMMTGPEFEGGVSDKIDDKDVYGGLIIQAVYDTENENNWVEAARVEWNSTGIMSYSGTLEKDGKKPWRVRVIHDSLEYRTECNIEVNVCLRADSPVMETLMEEHKDESGFFIQLKNYSAAIGASYAKAADGTLSVNPFGFTEGSDDYNHNYVENSENGLAELTKTAFEDLYTSYYTEEQSVILPDRDAASALLWDLNKTSQASKTAQLTNDAAHSRVQVNYRLTAYDGYEVPDKETADYLKRMNVESPGKKYVMFYDLLPHGVRFDPSVDIIAGRITDLDNNYYYQSRPDRWNSSKVKVTVNTSRDVIENWNGTGRMMVVFHIAYEGEDPAVYTNGRWIEGWGLSFGAYYDWKDIKAVQSEDNIMAFMPDIEKYNSVPELKGSDGVYVDDGSIVNNNSAYSDFYRNTAGRKLNQKNDGTTSNVMYASYRITEENTDSSTSGIEKLVRADADILSVYEKKAYVQAGEGYTYELTVTAPAGGLKNIVIFDHLENAGVERNGVSDPNAGRFGESWTGMLQSVDLTGLAEQGIQPVIWYNAARNASTTYWKQDGESGLIRYADGKEVAPISVLTPDNGWYEAETYISNYISTHQSDETFGALTDAEKRAEAVASVGSVAVDLRKSATADADGSTDFLLTGYDKISFRIKMKAPEWSEDFVNKNAFNNPSYYSRPANGTGENIQTANPVGESVRVGIGNQSILEVQKTFGNESEVPSALKGKSFTFTLYREDADGKELPVANREYILKEWDIDAKDWKQIEANVPHTTLADGTFTLAEGQKAVFEKMPMEEAGSVKVREEADIYWFVEDNLTSETATDGTVTFTHEMINTYHPVLYIQKNWAGIPEEMTEEEAERLASTDFTFQLKLDGVPQKVEYCYVRRASLNGNSPEIISGSAKPDVDGDGKLYTDENGQFTIRKGEIIALLIPKADTTYELTELKASITEKAEETQQNTEESNDNTENPSDTKTEEKVTDTTGDWLIDSTSPAASGAVPQGGAKAEVKNYYRWRDLYLTKTITHQEASECNVEFSFRIKDEEGNLVTDKKWQLQNADGSLASAGDNGTNGEGVAQYIGGMIGADGIIKAPCAGRVIKIAGLEADKTYIVEEVDIPDLYVPVESSKEVWMPTDAASQTVAFINDYQMRTISVTKTVVANEVVDRSFEMIIAKKETGGNYSYGPFTYSVDGGESQITENGHFFLKNGETAEFKHIGKAGEKFYVWEVADESYPQLYPIAIEGTETVAPPSGYTYIAKQNADTESQEHTDNEPKAGASQVGVHNRIVLGENDSAKFINGTPGTLMISKEYVGAKGDTPQQAQKNQEVADAIKQRITRQMEAEALEDFVSLCWSTSVKATELVDRAQRLTELCTQAANGTFSASSRYSILYECCVLVKEKMLEYLDEIDGMDPNALKPWNSEVFRAELGTIWNDSLTNDILEIGVNPFEEGGMVKVEEYFQTAEPKEWAEADWWANKLKEVDSLSEKLRHGQKVVSNLLKATHEDIKALQIDWDTDAFDVTVHLAVDGLDWVPVRSDKVVCIDQIGGQVYRIEYNPGNEEGLEPHWSMVRVSQYGAGADEEVADEEQKIFGWTENGDFQIKPYMVYVIPLHSEDAQYTLTEVDWNGSSVPELGRYGTDYVIIPEVPKTGEAITEKVKEAPEAVIRNEVKLPVGSLIEKRMTSDSDPVPVTAKLVWQIEKFDAAADMWVPAEGVEYVVKEGNVDAGKLQIHTVSTKTEKTDAHGQLTLHRGEAGNTYLAVQFLKDTVYLNLDEETFNQSDIREDGILRVREVLEESDTEWGMLAGYGIAGDDSQYGNASYKVAKAFVNSNQLVPIEIEKYVEEGGNKEFTMILEQKQTDPSTDQIVYLPYNGAKYTIYNADTKKEEGRGSTDKDGKILLRDGQYVKLNLPLETLWSVREDLKDRPDYSLASLEAENDAKEILNFQETIEGTEKVKRMLINLKTSQTTPGEEQNYVLTGYDVQNGVIDAETGALVVLKEGEVTIPQSILKNGVRYTITAIGDGAFRRCDSLTKIVIPENITKIGASAFEDCEQLQIATISESVTEIGASAFRGTGLSEVQIPASIKQIADFVFADCENLQKVTLPNQVKAIGKGAFTSCSALTEISIPETVESIGEEAFKLTGLKDVVIPEKVTSVGKEAFARCQSLKKVEIKGSLDRLTGHGGIFDQSLNLEEIVISGYVKEIVDYAFNAQEGNERQFGYAKLKKIVISGKVDVIGSGAFDQCMNLTDLSITGEVGKIGSSAFWLCVKLVNVDLSGKIGELENEVFGYCKSLETITIPESLRKISMNIFRECTALKQVTIPAYSVEVIEANAFDNCSSLKGIIIPEGVKEIQMGAFNQCSALTNAVISGTVEYIGDGAFADCSSLETITLQEGIKTIGNQTFANCTALKEVTIPGSVESLGWEIFIGCGSLEKIVLQEGIKEIGDGAFVGSPALKEVVIPDGVESIGQAVFAECYELSEVCIPESVKWIGDSAFAECYELNKVYIPENVSYVGRVAFAGCSQLNEVYITNPTTQMG